MQQDNQLKVMFPAFKCPNGNAPEDCLHVPNLINRLQRAWFGRPLNTAVAGGVQGGAKPVSRVTYGYPGRDRTPSR
jgi:hypothetical protein